MNIRVRTGIILLLLSVEVTGFAISAPELLYKRRRIDSLLRILPLSASQQRIDVLLEISRQYQSFSMDSSKEYARMALNEAKEQQNNTAMANAYKAIGSIFYFLGNYPEVLQCYDSSLRIYEMINDSAGMSKVWNNLGVVYRKIGDYEKSIDYHLKSLQCKSHLGDSIGLASSYNNIGSIYYDLENYEKSFEYFNKALRISERLNNEENVQTILNNLGLISQEGRHYQESLDFFGRAIDIGERINNKRGLADNYHNLGKSYFEMADYKTALSWYFKALEMQKDIGIESSHTLNNIGQLYIELDYYGQALKYLIQALNTAKENNRSKLLQDIYLNLSVVYERTGQFKEAYRYYVLFNEIDNSIKSKMYSSRLEEIYNQFELEKLQEHHKITERENNLRLELEVKRRNLLLYSISAIIVAFIVFVVIVIRVLKQKARANLILREQNEEILKSDKIIKKINKALKENEEMLRSIFDASPYSIIVIDEERQIIDCNQTSLRTFGVRKKRDMVKKYFDDLFDPKQVKPARESFNKALHSKTPESYRYDMVKENGKTFPVELSGRVIQDDRGKMIAYIAIITDITERMTFIQNLEKAKADAEASDRLKTAFLANMSHEIRTPMNAIVGFSNLLSDSKLPETKKKEYLDHIIQSSNMLLNLIDDIIDISKIEAGQISINKQEFNINKVIHDVFKNFSNVNKKANIDFRLQLPPSGDSSLLHTDPVRLRQILSNLIGNAIKFTERGFIEIGYDIQDSVPETNIRFYVKDSGIGIPKDKQLLIFERFRQLDDTRTRRFGGTGLGLSISKKLVELLGGSIGVESEPGEGSVFYFTIPYTNEGLQVREEPETFSFTKYNWKNKTILIAEDENSNFELIKASIHKTGIRIIRAMNGEEALEIALSTHDIDLVLMDIRMPKMNGYDATRKIKAVKPELPVISITAYAMSEDEEKSLEAGCDRYISKPIRPARLLELMAEYLS